MNKVLLVSVFGGGLGNNRQNNILYRQRENTVLITSDFNHEKKGIKRRVKWKILFVSMFLLI